jgi:very-short-patch-repair endonuclease
MREGQKRDFARQLRAAMTDAESRLWQRLRRRQMAGVRFRRQFPLGPYIVDFISLERRLIIEVDGGQHAPCVDAGRDDYLRSQGFTLLSFWNNEVLVQIEGVCDVIFRHLSEERPHPGLPPQAGEGDKPRAREADTLLVGTGDGL